MAHQQDAQAVAERWATRLGQASEKIKAGVAGVTTSPGQAAAAAASLWQQRVSDPATLQKYQNNVARMSLSDWQSSMTNKGLARISQGASAAVPKMQTFLSQFLPFVNGIAARTRQMPKGSLEDRINRMVYQVRETSKFRRQ